MILNQQQPVGKSDPETVQPPTIFSHITGIIIHRGLHHIRQRRQHLNTVSDSWIYWTTSEDSGDSFVFTLYVVFEDHVWSESSEAQSPVWLFSHFCNFHLYWRFVMF